VSPLALIRDPARDVVVCDRCELAVTPVARMRGLLGRAELPAGDGLLLRPAGSVHTHFMRFAIDVVFLDRDLQVLATHDTVVPWRMHGRRGAKAVLELAPGEAARRGVSVGDRLVVTPVTAAA
jgi:uncharacterized membrane protein (UPF0127 family)